MPVGVTDEHLLISNISLCVWIQARVKLTRSSSTGRVLGGYAITIGGRWPCLQGGVTFVIGLFVIFIVVEAVVGGVGVVVVVVVVVVGTGVVVVVVVGAAN